MEKEGRRERDVLRQLSSLIDRIPNLEKFLKTITNLIVEVFGVSKGLLVLHDKKSGRQQVKITTTLKEGDITGAKVRTMEAIVTWLTKQEEVLTQKEISEEGQEKLLATLKEELEIMDSSISAPLKTEEDLIGILNLSGKVKSGAFTPEDLRLLSSLIEFLSSIVNHALFYHTLSRNGEYRKSILESIPSGIITVDSKRRVTTFNKGAERILGLKSRQIMRKNIQIVEEGLARLLVETLETGKEYWRKKLYIQPESIPLGVSTSRIYNSRGEVIGAAEIFVDLSTIEKEEEERYEKEQKALWNRIATSLSHEIKNSLSAINALVQLLPEKHTDEAFRKTFCDVINHSTKRLDNFVERIVRFAQPRRLEFQVADIHRVIDDVLSSVLEKRKPKEITFTRKYTRNLPEVNFDYQELKEVFTILLHNGIEAIAEGGNITISTGLEKRKGNDFVEITFTDTGRGIAKKDLDKVFGPFFTLSKGRASLGLAIAKRIVEDHQGFIGVKSSLGEKSTFSILLPVKVKSETN